MLGKGHLLRGGEVVAYALPPPRAATLSAEDVPYTLVYEDEALLVVDKPAGVVVHPAPGHEHGTLVQGLLPAASPAATSRARASCIASTATRRAC